MPHPNTTGVRHIPDSSKGMLPACHKKSYSCFAEQALNESQETMSPVGSTSNMISANPGFQPEMQSTTTGFQRRRLDTADTPVMRNFPLDCGEYIKTPPGNSYDDCSVVSSLSNDDSLIRLSENAEVLSTKISLLPPKEVVIPEAGDPSVPNWLRDIPTSMPTVQSRASLPAPASAPRVDDAVAPSPLIPRPTFGRNKSCPPMDFSTASSSKATQPSAYSLQSTPLNSIVVNGKVITDVSYRSGMTDPFGNPQQCKLLGQRPRRHVRSQSLASASCGSMSLTAPTATSTISGTTISSRVAQQKLNSYTGADDGMACCRTRHEAVYRKRNIVKEEFKFMLNRMSAPIKKIPFKKQSELGDVNLERANGCLT